ncbi:threonine aldolase family protein [Pontibaca salina]|uniref:L-threonine aldolase n=1 Tax=Pontibaca salina TaxID=2795731 RepID=A0A934HLB7_9RHOB|nr:beta-eliminating lyase-related protein [Pontibaca salina]MBI6630213.1 low specificity L-threonine aldolase [Pontibaca salina]
MFFASDNAGPVHPKVMAALHEANTGHALPYGDDELMDEVRQRLRDLFEAPDAAVYLVATGTAANALALATMCKPWQTVFCSPVAHIQEDECNAPEFYSGGAKLTLVPGGDRMCPEALRSAIKAEENRGVHGPQRGPVSITQVTESGTVYDLDELRALTEIAQEFQLPVHMDGARIANAVVKLDCTLAQMTWKLGVDAVSFGGTKNGLMGVEAVIFFDPAKAQEFEYRRKRGAHLFSKHRYLSAQMAAYLRDDLWRECALKANANARRLAQGLEQAGAEILHRPDANMVFAALPRRIHHRLLAAGAQYYPWTGDFNGPADEMLGARLVCDWSLDTADINRFLDILQTSVSE